MKSYIRFFLSRKRHISFTSMTMAQSIKYIDIAANLADPMYEGIYNESSKHPADLGDVLQRAWDSGLDKIIITGTSLRDSQKALEIANTHEKLFCTVGCHPTCSLDFEKNDADGYLHELEKLAKDNRNKVVAVGEFGLDFDRLKFAPKDIQIKYFERQLEMNERLKLPMFLHCRAAASDFLEIICKYKSLVQDCGGVVHSFDGTEDDARNIVDVGLHIGINGCSLKTEDNLRVVKTIPKERLLIETDCPWCEIRPRHAGYPFVKNHYPSLRKEKWQRDQMVKSRNEPANIQQVMEVVSSVRGEDKEMLAKQIYENTVSVFFPHSQTTLTM